MRIAYMLTSLGIGGAEKQVVALADHMATRGHAVLLIVLKARGSEQWPTKLNTVYLDFSKSPAAVFRGMVHARRLLRNFRPDLVHSHTFHANLVARLLKGLARFRVISTFHNVYEGGRLRMLAYRLTDRLAVQTTAVSEAVARSAIQAKAVPPEKCSVMANYIDTSEFSPDPARRAETRALLGAADDFIWLAVGRVVAAKGFLNLLQAFAKVWPEFPHTQLWIAGAGANGRASIAQYAAIAVPCGTMDRVRRLGLRRDIPALFDGADAFALSSAWEGMPLVVGEAMAMEKPVVATDVGGVRELVGDPGWLVPARDPEALAASMLRVMRRPVEIRKSAGKASRMRILEYFSTTARFPAWEDFYQSVLK